MNTIKTRFIQIGNSRGIRVPKVLIEQLGLGGEVELSVQDNRLVIQSAEKRRKGWEQEFQKMAAVGDDKLLLADDANAWDEDEWKW